MSVHLRPPSRAAQLHNKCGVLCVTVDGSVQDKNPLGAFGLRKSKAKASQPGFLSCLRINTEV